MAFGNPAKLVFYYFGLKMSYVTEGPSSKLCVLLRGNETSE